MSPFFVAALNCTKTFYLAFFFFFLFFFFFFFFFFSAKLLAPFLFSFFSPTWRSETSPDYIRVSFYLHCSLDVNKQRGRVMFPNATMKRKDESCKKLKRIEKNGPFKYNCTLQVQLQNCVPKFIARLCAT